MDVADRAEILEQKERDAALQRVLNVQNSSSEIINTAGGYTCIDCGDNIPKNRVDALKQNGRSVLRCLHCQEYLEKTRRYAV